ncbi:TraB/GumN family protein [bacterium]|nr:TraB/GumN family protein [bacterium]
MKITNRNLTKILLLFSLLLLISCASKPEVKTEPEALPMLWKIEGENPSYLLGTFHLPDERILDLPNVVRNRYNEADIYVLEVEMDLNAMTELAQYIMLPEGKTLKTLMSEELYQRVSDILTEKGQNIEMFNMIKPWVLYSIIAIPPGLEEQPMDMALYNEAVEKGKETAGLETVKEQVMIFDNLTLEEQIQMLEKNVEEYEKFDEILETMISYYLQGDLEGLTNYMNGELVEEEYEDLYDNLITKRNHLMVERMQEYLKNGNAFIAVGAGHLGGDDGIIAMLEKQGYKISRCREENN